MVGMQVGKQAIRCPVDQDVFSKWGKKLNQFFSLSVMKKCQFIATNVHNTLSKQRLLNDSSQNNKKK